MALPANLSRFHSSFPNRTTRVVHLTSSFPSSNGFARKEYSLLAEQMERVDILMDSNDGFRTVLVNMLMRIQKCSFAAVYIDKILNPDTDDTGMVSSRIESEEERMEKDQKDQALKREFKNKYVEHLKTYLTHVSRGEKGSTETIRNKQAAKNGTSPTDDILQPLKQAVGEAEDIPIHIKGLFVYQCEVKKSALHRLIHEMHAVVFICCLFDPPLCMSVDPVASRFESDTDSEYRKKNGGIAQVVRVTMPALMDGDAVIAKGSAVLK
jgi:hypothetical protein